MEASVLAPLEQTRTHVALLVAVIIGDFMAQVIRSPKIYDVCIIGSGAGGGTAAKVLTEGGLNVVMLEAGPPLDPDKDFKEHVWPYQLAHRGVGIGGKQTQFGDEFMAPNGFWEIEGEPYTTARVAAFAGSAPALKAAEPIIGAASRCASARRISGRAPLTAWATTGRSPTRSLRPTTTRSSRYIGVFGTKENIPNSPDGVFLPPPRPRCTETIIKKACDKLNITCIPSRLAILTKPLNGRDACHYCAQCGRGCMTRFQLQLQPGDDSARRRPPAASP